MIWPSAVKTRSFFSNDGSKQSPAFSQTTEANSLQLSLKEYGYNLDITIYDVAV